MSPSRTPTLSELIRLAIEARLAGVHVSVPGRVEKYDASKQRADIKPLVKTAQGESVPVITNVPIIFPGGGGFRVVFPVVKGDTVLLVFCERSIDNWKKRGGEVDPIDTRHHALSDAVAYVGLRAESDAMKDAPTGSMKVGKDAGSVQAEFKDDEVEIGGGGAAPAQFKGAEIVLAGGRLPVARATDPLQGTAGPYPIAGVIAPTAGNQKVKA
jgi:hypothetical protein